MTKASFYCFSKGERGAIFPVLLQESRSACNVCSSANWIGSIALAFDPTPWAAEIDAEQAVAIKRVGTANRRKKAAPRTGSMMDYGYAGLRRGH